MPSLALFRSGIGGGLTSADNLDVFANGATTLTPTALGRIRLRERVTFPDNYVLTANTTDALITATPLFTASSPTNLFYGFRYGPTFAYSVSQTLSQVPAFYAYPTFKPTASGIADALTIYTGFFSQPTLSLGFASGSMTTVNVTGYYSQLAFKRDLTTSTSTSTVPVAAHFFCAPSNVLSTDGVSTGLTVSIFAGLYVSNLQAITGTITEFVGAEIEDLTRGGTNLSLRSRGAAVNMRHAGPARFGGTDVSAIGGSILQVDGGLTLKRTVTVDANYTALLTDTIIEITLLSAARTITLPSVASAGVGKIYICKKTTGAFALNVGTTDLVDGVNPLSTTTANYQALRVYCTGTTWLSF